MVSHCKKPANTRYAVVVCELRHVFDFFMLVLCQHDWGAVLLATNLMVAITYKNNNVLN